MDLLVTELIGAPGLILLILAFYLNVSKKIKRFSLEYNGLNLAGAAILTYYAYLIDAPVFIGLEFIWFLVALYFLGKSAVKT